jgi:RNA polymerase sigma-70 factor (ECF subfamily)
LTDLEDIITGCISNNRVSQEKLYRQFYPGLHALCRQFFQDEQDIVTALNNGMLNVYKNISSYDTSKGEFLNWCYTIVRNAAITYLRTIKSLNTVQLDTALHADYCENPLIELEWEDLFSYLDKLPPATRAVSSLYYREGFSIKEISQQLSISDGTVKWHLSECRNKLSKLLHP